MAHDIVILRTNPEFASLRQKLEEAYDGCRAAFCGVPETDNSSAAPGTPPDTDIWCSSYVVWAKILTLKRFEMFYCLSYLTAAGALAVVFVQWCLDCISLPCLCFVEIYAILNIIKKIKQKIMSTFSFYSIAAKAKV